MAIISAAICDKQGKIYLARQFDQITKHNLEENIRTFPKLISPQQQHTFVENEYVRYVYMPIDNMYIVLVTTKNSNIIEHQETIRLIYKVITELCPLGINEETINENVFDIILAFDDIISFGYRESISLQQVGNAIEMESSEEKIHLMLMQARMNEAKEKADKYAKEQEQFKKHGISPQTSQQHDFTSKHDILKSSQEVQQSDEIKEQQYKPTNMAPKKGMQLGKKKTAKETQKEFQKQQQQKQKEQKHQNQQNNVSELDDEENNANKPFDPLKEPVHIEQIEKFSVKLTRDGSIAQNIEVIGEVYITILDPARTKTQIALDSQPSEHMKNVKLQLHPSLNKQLWTKNKVVSLKTPDQQDFPVNTKIPTIKYKYISQDNKEMPFTFTFWFDQTVIYEIEFDEENSHFQHLENLAVRIPYTDNSSNIEIKEVENGDFEIQNGEGITWNILKLNQENPSAKIEIAFNGEQPDEEDLFPVNLYFEYPQKTFLDLKVRGVREVTKSENLKYLYTQKIQSDKFFIE